MKNTRFILAIDCETNDKPKDWQGREDDVDNWPRLVQCGMVLSDEDGRIVRRSEELIDGQGYWCIEPDAGDVHGIDQTNCDRWGMTIGSYIENLSWFLEQADIIVAHNMKFDWSVLLCESIRSRSRFYHYSAKRRCTMLLAKERLHLHGNHGHGPKLCELHQYLFGIEFEGAHSALADAEACLRCYLKMMKEGFIDAT